MIAEGDLGVQDSEMMTTAVAISQCRLRLTWDASILAGDEAAGTLSVSLGVMIRPHKQI